MNTATRWVPRLITATGVVHLAYGVVAPSLRRPLGAIVDASVVNTIDGHPERESWLWYMLTGVSCLGLGETVRWSVRETGRVPARLGGWLLAFAVPLIIASPASGGWLVAAVGGFALRAARPASTRPAAVAAPRPSPTRS